MKNNLMIICITVLLGTCILWNANPACAESPAMTKWEDPLPIPPVATKTFKPLISLVADYYEIDMRDSQHQFNSGLPGPATVWTYGQPGSDPVLLGPTIVAKTGRPVIVKYINNLPTGIGAFPLAEAIDNSLPGSDTPSGAAIPHLHGGHTAARFDGTPMQWWTADGEKGMDFKTDTFTYLNDQPASLLWYHDHTMGATRLKPYLGLAAAYLIFDNVDDGNTITVDGPDKDKKGKLIKHIQKVPSGYGIYHLPIVLQDKQFNEDGTLFYPTEGLSPTHPIWVPEFFGDTPVINGKAYPKLDAEPRRYRLRFLNGSQATFYNVAFNVIGTTNYIPFWVIGSEGGLLPAPKQTTELLIAPGERFDVIIDFKGLSGKEIMMTNDANAPYPSGEATLVPKLMKIEINQPLMGGLDDTVDPADLILPASPRLTATKNLKPRDIVLKENMVDAFTVSDEPEEQVPGEVLLNGYHFMEPVTDIIKAGTTEAWQWINLTGDAHPMHMHLVTFQVVNRQAFDVDSYTADWAAYLASGRTIPKPDINRVKNPYLIGSPIGPEPEEMGYKDTVKAYPGYVTRIVAKFDLPATSLLDYNLKTGVFGNWVYHCHILEHEENDMMRPFQVVR
jgi:spore coat protein A, manganese oxidase